MNDMDSLIKLIDERIDMKFKKLAFEKKRSATVVSYNSVDKSTVVTFSNDTTQTVLRNLSADTLVQGDTVLVLYTNGIGSDLSKGHIYGKIS